MKCSQEKQEGERVAEWRQEEAKQEGDFRQSCRAPVSADPAEGDALEWKFTLECI